MVERRGEWGEKEMESEEEGWSVEGEGWRVEGGGMGQWWGRDGG